jgi:hypothetical protein
MHSILLLARNHDLVGYQVLRSTTFGLNWVTSRWRSGFMSNVVRHMFGGLGESAPAKSLCTAPTQMLKSERENMKRRQPPVGEELWHPRQPAVHFLDYQLKTNEGFMRLHKGQGLNQAHSQKFHGHFSGCSSAQQTPFLVGTYMIQDRSLCLVKWPTCNEA